MGWDGALTLGVGVLGVLVVAVAFVPRLRIVTRPDVPPGRTYVADSGELTRHGDGLDILTWGVSQERDSYLKRRLRVEFTKTGAFLILFSGISTVVRFPSVRDYGWLAIAAAGVLIGAAWVPYLSARAAFWERRKATAAARVDRAIRDLGAGEPKLSLPKLYELNRRQLDQYQELTRKQETSAYRLAQLASFVALAVLVAGLAVSLSSESSIDKYVGGGLSGLGAALSAFLAATFFKSHRQASKQLNRYYLEPQRTGRLLAAERIAALDPGIAPAILSELVAALMSWEMPGPVKAGEPSAPSTDDAAPSSPVSPVTRTRFTTRSSPPASSGSGATSTTG